MTREERRGEESGVDFLCILYSSLSFSQTLGGNGYMNDYPTGRLLRDAKLYEIGAGTSEIRRMIIGKSMVQEYQSSGGI